MADKNPLDQFNHFNLSANAQLAIGGILTAENLAVKQAEIIKAQRLTIAGEIFDLLINKLPEELKPLLATKALLDAIQGAMTFTPERVLFNTTTGLTFDCNRLKEKGFDFSTKETAKLAAESFKEKINTNWKDYAEIEILNPDPPGGAIFTFKLRTP